MPLKRLGPGGESRKARFYFIRTDIKTERNPQYKFTFMCIFIIIEILHQIVYRIKWNRKCLYTRAGIGD